MSENEDKNTSASRPLCDKCGGRHMPAMDCPPFSLFEDSEKLVRALVGSPALAKACFDSPFDYALRLRTGEVIAFSGASVVNREWVHLEAKPPDEQPEGGHRIAYPAARGVDVRMADIVWVMDAPNGS